MITAQDIDRTIRFQGGGLPVVSVYLSVPVDPADRAALPTRLSALLHQIRPLTADESLGREQRMSLRGDIEALEARASEEMWTRGTVALFSCSGRGMFEEFHLPRRTRDRVMADAAPWVRPMLAVLDEYHRYCVAVVDRAASWIWEVYQDEIREVERTRDEFPRKPDFAAWFTEYRVRNRAEELSKRHFRAVATRLADLFRTGAPELLIIGGHRHEVAPFLAFLPDDLRARVAGTFTLDPGTATPDDIRKHADHVIERYERDEERRMVAELFEKAESGGPAAAGLRDSLWAGTVAAAGTLAVQDGATARGVACDRDGWLAPSGATCPLCGTPTRRTEDILDELAETVIDEGGSVKHVRAETRLRDHLAAVSLRFPLPARPDTAPAPAG
ncbi:baeRF10 domain-containing protein [Marinitenerispora sediminis]|uniref:eRF1 domain-containing protein n=1 Tax=Marinitenerispora sediminis TaxID=1931232 RepID=A0A368T8S4_9ACTN|nr:hypothetical protein [Marinitenerispora sediminis]RCV54678.1 hypothetical protein DEF28_07570 [Marinitenerispora sediminis]RCV54743.1 hypothetical protein DEF23_15390 [Marinitenerispora sediminis]RCV58879.1 hypothetical protein DEF24_11860 [Marinitenerispora sediminis]